MGKADTASGTNRQLAIRMIVGLRSPSALERRVYTQSGVNMAKPSNEWEFQGEAITWVNAFLASHPVGLDMATQEFANADGRRSDLTIWKNHGARIAVLTAELKTPVVSMGDIKYQRDAVRKAQLLNSPYLALWNIKELKLFKTPASPRKDLLPEDFLHEWEPDPLIRSVADWLTPAAKARLRDRANDLVIRLNDLLTTGAIARTVVEATVFVSFLTERVRLLRHQIYTDLGTSLSASKKLRTDIVKWADRQGLRYLVGDLYSALAGQVAYRIVGQTLFYLAFRRQQPSLPALTLDPSKRLYPQLRSRWDAIRAYDYEALFEPSPLEDIQLSTDTEQRFVTLIDDLDGYDWSSIHSDVLGRVFEQLIPGDERIALGQYYTSDALADVILGLALDTPTDRVLDPAVGTGTFLRRAHQRLRNTTKLRHEEILDRLWGIDISAFAAELAVINLCRQDLDSQSNFPRIAVRDFFDLKTTERLSFPPAQHAPGSPNRVEIPIPVFDAVVGNPPYVRSQQLDDIDASYKRKLARVALDANLPAAVKFDAFAYFILHARKFLRPGGRLGFVTSAAWLTSSYGSLLKTFILRQFQPAVLLFSLAEPFFPEVAVDTVVVVLEAVAESSAAPSGPIRFVTLLQPLSAFLPPPTDPGYWPALEQLVVDLENKPTGQHEGFSVFELNAAAERLALTESPNEPRNWARPFRVTPIYQDLFS